MRWSSLGFAGDGKLCSFSAGGIIACGFGFMMLATGIQSGFWSSHMITFVICESHWVCVHMQAIVSYTIFQSIQCADDASCSSCLHQISLWCCLSATKILSTWACTHGYNNAHCTHRDLPTERLNASSKLKLPNFTTAALLSRQPLQHEWPAKDLYNCPKPKRAPEKVYYYYFL
jgi:hypothetical protein